MRRTGAVLLGACLTFAGSVVVTPPAGAATGPVVVDLHDRVLAAQAVHLSADGDATVHTDGTGRSYLVRGPLATGERIVLRDGAPTRTDPYWGYPHDEVNDGLVVMPVLGAGGATDVDSVRWCAVAACPETSTYTVPDGLAYLGNGGDVAVLYDPTAHALVLAPWGGGAPAAVPLGAAARPYRVDADAAGIALSGAKQVSYLDRATGTVTVLGAGHNARLTQSYVAWPDLTNGIDLTIRRVARANPAATPVVVHQAAAVGSTYFAATETGVSFAAPGTRLGTKTWAGPPVTVGYLASYTVAPAADGTSFLVNHRLATPSGLYRISPGSTAKTFVRGLPPEPSAALSLAVSNGRVAYRDDTTPEAPLYVRAVTGSTLGPETKIAARSNDVATSGPMVAFTSPGSDPETERVSYGRAGVTFRSIELPTGGSSRLSASGRRAVVNSPDRSWLVNLQTGATKDLGDVRAAIFGQGLATLRDDGRVVLRNLSTGGARVVRAAPGLCPPACVGGRAHVATWGSDVLYAYDLGGSVVAGLWNAATGVTTPLPMLANPDWQSLSFWDGLLVVGYEASDGVIHDLRSGAAGVPIPGSRVLGSQAVDGYHVAYRAPGLRDRAVVQPVTDFLPSYRPTARFLGVASPAGFGPGLRYTDWRPALITTAHVEWRMWITQGGHDGPTVRTLSGTSTGGGVLPVWDGRTDSGAAAPHGRYSWSFSATDAYGAPVVDDDFSGTDSGQVFLSRVAPATPVVSAPALASDTRTDGRFTLRWSAPVPGDTVYRVQRARDGWSELPWSTIVPATYSRSMTVQGARGHTYRFRVAAVDPAGRTSANGTAQTVVPFADSDPRHDFLYGTGPWHRSTGASFWGGAHRYTGAGGNFYGFSAYGDTLWLIGTKGPGHGRMQVTVDHDRTYDVDTYAPTKRYRQVLFKISGLDPDEYHRISLNVLATAGRPLVSVDAVAARWLR